MANPTDTFNIASKKISEWEGGSQYHNPETDMWTVYDDVVGGNIPTVYAGLTGQIGGEDIQVGQQYPGSLLGQEFQGRMQGDYDWLSQNLGDSWGSLNPNQQAATMSLVHNVGADAFSKSKAFGHLKGGSSVNPNWLEDFSYEAFDPNEPLTPTAVKVLISEALVPSEPLIIALEVLPNVEFHTPVVTVPTDAKLVALVIEF